MLIPINRLENGGISRDMIQASTSYDYSILILQIRTQHSQSSLITHKIQSFSSSSLILHIKYGLKVRLRIRQANHQYLKSQDNQPENHENKMFRHPQLMALKSINSKTSYTKRHYGPPPISPRQMTDLNYQEKLCNTTNSTTQNAGKVTGIELNRRKADELEILTLTIVF